MPDTHAGNLPAFPTEAFDRLLPLAFAEDVGDGDVTTLATIEADAAGHAVLLCKQAGVIAGLPAIERVFRHRGAHPDIRLRVPEGARVETGTVVATMDGSLRALLTCERILLNFLQRCSGIATAARAYADALAGAPTRLLDTRKTPPGYRALDKYAVAIGGGTNHRMGLYDMVLVKENHIAAAGSLTQAVEAARRHVPGLKVEVEVETMQELEEAITARPDIIMLDNFSAPEMRKAVGLNRERGKHAKLEASGNVSLDNVRQIAETGVDFISVGGITKHVRAIDLSMRLEFRSA